MSSLFSGPQQSAPAAPPTPKPPAPMPDSMSPLVMEAKRKAQLDIMGRAGRSSTILTAPKERGGDSYSANTLGAGG